MYKILVAEDEMIERKVLCRTIERNLGELCTLCEAKNGREALALFESEHPEIAVLDIEMPGLNGLEVARRIRQSGRWCVILFLTAFDKFSYAKQAISVHAQDYLLKPCAEEEIILAIEEAMQYAARTAAHPPQELPERDAAPEDPPEDARLSALREQMQAYIDGNYGREISMQDAAQAMNYSGAYFCKLFKQCFQVNFSTYLNEYRVEKAKQLLENGHLSVKDAGVACGYTDANYFARVFKRVTGVKPSEYRFASHQAQ